MHQPLALLRPVIDYLDISGNVVIGKRKLTIVSTAKKRFVFNFLRFEKEKHEKKKSKTSKDNKKKSGKHELDFCYNLIVQFIYSSIPPAQINFW